MIPNPPKTKRITKALLLEVMKLLDELEYEMLMERTGDSRWGAVFRVDDRNLAAFSDRLCACRAHLHTWHEEDKRKKRMKHGKTAKVAVPRHGEASEAHRRQP